MSSSPPSEQSSSSSASSSSQAPQQSSTQQSPPSEKSTASKWTLSSLVADVVREEYKKENLEEFIDDDLKLLEGNRIKTLKQRADLSEGRKNLFPAGLAELLDGACKSQGKSDNTTICKRLISNTLS